MTVRILGLDAMKAGRALDALVAEKVMGIRPDYITLGPAMSVVSDDGDSWIDVQPVQNYSTDIAAAWEVVESRQFGVWNWHISQTDSSDANRRWFAEVRQGYCTSYDKAFPEWASTPALAICLAALKAVESQP